MIEYKGIGTLRLSRVGFKSGALSWSKAKPPLLSCIRISIVPQF